MLPERHSRAIPGDTTILASYGRSTWLPLVAVLAGCIVAAGVWLPWLLPLPLLCLAFVVWFFRDPNRRSDAPSNALISPADGKIVQITEVDEPEHIKGRARKIAIFMSVFDVHVNRAPCDVKVVWQRHVPGKFLNALGADASIQNEQVLLALERKGRPLLVKLIAGLVARRIVCRLKPGDALDRGRRLGMIKFGSRVEVFLPADEKFDIVVYLGQKVRAGSTVLGQWR